MWLRLQHHCWPEGPGLWRLSAEAGVLNSLALLNTSVSDYWHMSLWVLLFTFYSLTNKLIQYSVNWCKGAEELVIKLWPSHLLQHATVETHGQDIYCFVFSLLIYDWSSNNSTKYCSIDVQSFSGVQIHLQHFSSPLVVSNANASEPREVLDQRTLVSRELNPLTVHVLSLIHRLPDFSS